MDTKPLHPDHQAGWRPKGCGRVALVLQGGGALGAYQAGVYQALHEEGIEPDWVSGVSIGAINSAIIAGNPPEKRVDRLREFWRTVSTSPLGIPYVKEVELKDEFNHQLVNQARALGILVFGAPNFFFPRMPPALLWPGGSADKASYYDNKPLKTTLERLVDFDRINFFARKAESSMRAKPHRFVCR